MSTNEAAPDSPARPARKRYVRAIGPKLAILLRFLFAVLALLGANSLYLGAITFMEWIRRSSGVSYQNYFYQVMFLGHLGLGLLLIVPFLVFGALHIKNSHARPNRRAVRVGYALFITCIAVLITGIGLMRVGAFQVRSPGLRNTAYWIHVITPFAAVWLYILHRLAGPRIKWRVGLRWAAVAFAAVTAMVFLHTRDPRRWNATGPREGEKYFYPSLARTSTGNFIPAKVLMMDSYCMECHKDAYNDWFHSAHHFSSFNNKPYLFSVSETRQVSLKRDGNVKAARWCAGCHDPVPFFSGAFDNPRFDLEKDPASQAGITCTVCHAINHVNSTKGNADYTIDTPVHYPFAFSENPVLRYINRQLIKAKPEFHKQTFLKPLHYSAEFCSTCHKVSIPYALNHYKEFLRGQNHYDTFLLSGVSGHSARSFYYPEKAKTACRDCHMPLIVSNDFGARYFDPAKPQLEIHKHLFEGGNTGITKIRNDSETTATESTFLKDCVRVDIFGVKEGGAIESPLAAPLRAESPRLLPGKSYLFEIVLRTLKVGHPFTQGTVDSNEVWVDANMTDAETGRVIGRSGGLDSDNAVDPWSHFVNVYMLDKDGNRIDRRNPQDIFTPLYNHQIPPGAAQVVHFAFTVPSDQNGPVELNVKLQYRKFDSSYMHYVFGKDYRNDLPITTIASDHMRFAVGEHAVENPLRQIPEWERWNDYGIALFLEGDRGSENGELVQAEEAFLQVGKLGRPDGPVNLARVYLKEGRLDEASAALKTASTFAPLPPRWTVAWLTGLIDKQNGFLDKAIDEFQSILEDRSPDLQKRSFDFSKDYEVINELGQTLFERAKLERGDARKAQREKLLLSAAQRFEETLVLDGENVAAHYNLSLIYSELGNAELAEQHRALHERYRVDDNARDRAISIARKANPAADHAAQSVVIYPLQRPGAPGLQTAGKQAPPAASQSTVSL